MRGLSSSAKCFLRSEEGAASVEYGLLIGLLSLVAIAILVSLAAYVRGTSDEARSELANDGIPNN